MKWMRGLGLALQTTLAAFLLAGMATSEPNLAEDIQTGLLKLGYPIGSADGVAGRRTLKAIADFHRDFRLSETDNPISELTAMRLGFPGYAGPRRALILISDRESDELAEQIQSMNRFQLLDFIATLVTEDKGNIDTVFEDPKAVIFVVFGQLVDGDRLIARTQVIAEGHPTWSGGNFYLGIKSEPGGDPRYTVPVESTEPLVFINLFEAGRPLSITHRLQLNGDVIAFKRTRALN